MDKFTNIPALQKILNVVEPYQNELTDKWIDAINKNGEAKINKYDIEMYKLSLIVDLVKAVGNYIGKYDIIKNIDVSKRQNSIVIYSIIERDGKDYDFNTDVIVAGGYNIQQIHLRYIVNTKLPKLTINTEYKYLSEQLNKMKKAEKIRKDVKVDENIIKNLKNKLQQQIKNSNLSDKEIEFISKKEEPNKWEFNNISWETIIERGADKNYNYDKQEFIKAQEEEKKRKIEFWRFINADVKGTEYRIKSKEKDIQKAKKKLLDLGYSDEIYSYGGLISGWHYNIGGI